MNLKQKLIVGFLAISLLVGIVGIIGLYANNEIVKSFESGTEHFGSIMNAGNEVSSFAKRAEGHTMLYITLHNETDRGKAYQRIVSLREQIAILDVNVDDPNARKVLDDIITSTNELELIVKSLFAAYDVEMKTTGQFKPENHEELIRKLDAAGSSIRRSGLKLTRIELEVETEHNLRAKQKASSLYKVIFIISGFAVFTALFTGLLIYRNISIPISKLRDSAVDIGKGNLEARIEITSNDEIGELAHTFNSMAQDLQKSNDAIISANEYTDSIIRSMNDSLIVTSLEGVIQSVNMATTLLLGYNEDELMGKNIAMVQTDLNQSVLEIWKNELNKNGYIKNIETIYKSKDLRQIPIILSASLIHDKNQNIQGIVYVAKDLSDRKLNEELERMNKISVGKELQIIEHRQRIAELELELEMSKK